MNEKEAIKRLETIEKRLCWLHEKREVYLGWTEAKERGKKRLEKRKPMASFSVFVFIFILLSLAFYLIIFYLPPLPTGYGGNEKILISLLFGLSFVVVDTLPIKLIESSVILKNIDSAIEQLEKEREEIYEEFPNIQVSTGEIIKTERKMRFFTKYPVITLYVILLLLIKFLPPIPLAMVAVGLPFIFLGLDLIYQRFVLHGLKKALEAKNG